MSVPVDADNAELLRRAAVDDQLAWRALVARYNGLVWSVARGFRLDPADAADAVQVTWLRLVEYLERIEEPERLGAWLATTVRRECLQLIRRSAHRREDHAPELLDTLADPAPPPEAMLLRDERDAALWRALGALSEQCRRLLRILMASPPPRYADVAATLGIAVGTIGPARQRCLERLRDAARMDGLLSEDAPTAEEH